MDIKSITIFLFLPILLFSQSHSIIIDGNPSDWIGTPSSTIHGTTYSAGEWIYTGEANDMRTEPGLFWVKNEDITEVRFATDGTNFLGLIKVDNISAIDLGLYSIAINNGTGTINWIGDDTQSIFGNNIQQASIYFDIHFITRDGQNNLHIELNKGSGWYFASNNAAVNFSYAYNCIEFSIPLTELGLESNSNITLTFATFFKNEYTSPFVSNNEKDNTYDLLGSDAIDVMTPGAPESNILERENYLIYGVIQHFAQIDLSLAPLPVELVSFGGIFINNSIQLNWETATEVSNYGFEILRSSESEQWKKIGFIPGHGNSAYPNQYSFIDNNATIGEFSYQLNQIDLDGTSELSEIITIKAGELISSILLNQNYPNPFNPRTQISFAVKEKCNLKLVVYDLLGNEIANLFNGEVLPNKVYKAEFDGTNLSSGIYFYQLITPRKIEVKKMLLIK
ncbi:hypothetical protein APF79_08085 [bacterium BRH_c32]|nr:MAG: hypothetical protein APF79_08085 [bacterium BRH_c32]